MTRLARRAPLVVVLLMAFGCQNRSASQVDEPKFELQGFSVSFAEKKSDYGAFTSTLVNYNGRGNLVLVSPSPSDGRHYEVWLRFKQTCGQETTEVLQSVPVLNGIGTVATYCGGSKMRQGRGTEEGDAPRQPPTYEWGEVVAYRELRSASLTIRK